MRWLSLFVSSFLVMFGVYALAIPYFGQWIGLSLLPPDKQQMFIACMLSLAIGASILIGLLRGPTILFTIMSGGAGMGAITLLSFATNSSDQPIPPELMKGGIMIGGFIGFCISLGAALATILIRTLMDTWVIPRLVHSPDPPDKLQLHAATRQPGHVRQTPRTSPLLRWALVLLAGILLMPLSKKIEWPILGSPSHNPNYHLLPSVWEGSITYKHTDYAFTLVFEEVSSTGQLIGYMDWPPQGGMEPLRLVVEGTANGNHLVFEDTDFLIGNGLAGAYDKKDVMISGDRMVGTDKNGTATLHARRTKTAPPTPSLLTAVGFRAAQQSIDAAWGKHRRTCEALQQVEEGRLAPACWSELAVQAKQASLCQKLTNPRTRAACHVDVVWQTGEWRHCESLQYAIHSGDCVNAAVAKSGEIEACRLLEGETFVEAYRICQAIARRDPESCARLPADFHGLRTQADCWQYLAVALRNPRWCEQLASTGRSPASCHAFVQAHLTTATLPYVSDAEIEGCQSHRVPIEQDSCFLKLVSRGAVALCSRVQHAKLQTACMTIAAL